MAEENGYKPTYDPLMNHLLFGKQAQQPVQNWAGVLAQLGSALIQRNQDRQQGQDYVKMLNDMQKINVAPQNPQTSPEATAALQNDANTQQVNQQPLTAANFEQNSPLYQAGVNPPGILQPGNIDLSKRPIVKNPDGSISTVRSMGVNIDGKEVLIPTVSMDGRIMSDQEAIDTYKKTGQHLGIFDSPQASDSYAQSLHNQQAGMYSNPVSTNTINDPNLSQYDQWAKERTQNEADQGVQKFFPNWQPNAPASQVDPSKYKNNMQTLINTYDQTINDGTDPTQARGQLVSAVKNYGTQYGSVPAFGNDSRYIMNQAGIDPTQQQEALSTNVQPQRNALPTPQMLSPLGVSQQIKSQIPAAAKQLLALGHKPAQFMPLLLQQAKDQTDAYTQQYQLQAQNSIINNISQAKDLRSAMPYVMQASQPGVGLKIDTRLLTEALKTPDMKPVTLDLGGEKHLMAYNPKTGEYKDMYTGQVSMNPYQSGSLALKSREISDKENGVGGYGRAPGRPGVDRSAAQVAKYTDNYNKEEGRFRAWEEKNPGADGNDYPYKESLYTAQERAGIGGSDSNEGQQSSDSGSPSQQTGPDEQDVRAYMSMYGKSREEAIQALAEAGG